MNRTSTAALEATATRFGHSLATQIAYRRLSPSRKRKLPFADDTVQGIYKGLDEDDIEGGGFKLIEYLIDGTLAVVMAKTYVITKIEYVYRVDVYGKEEA